MSAPPSDVILMSLKEIVDAVQAGGKNKYGLVVEKCLILLKRKKTINDLGLTGPIQRILLQTWLQQDEHDKVLDWVTATEQEGHDNNNKNRSSSSPTALHKDLILYARYRKQQYETVAKQASLRSNENVDDDDDEDDTMSTLALQHLVAQSHFHMNHADSALRVYHDFLAETSGDQYDVESHMEVLTNALAVIASSGTVPQVTVQDGGEMGYRVWIDQAEEFLRDQGEDISTDLALNLGTLQFLSDPTSVGTASNWLERAMDASDRNANAGEKDSDDHIQIQTNLQWSKHFWYKDVEDVVYPTSKGTTSSARNGTGGSYHTLPVSQYIAILNQSLLVDDLGKVPSQPHPKWNSLQVVMYWYSRAVLQFKAKQFVECQESCQSLKKAVSILSGGTTGGGGIGGGKKKKTKAGSGGASSTTPSAASSSLSSSSMGSPMHLWWESRVDVLLAHVLHSQSKTKDAITKLDTTLKSLRGVSPSSLILDHAIAHVQLHRYMLLDQSSTTTAAPKKNQHIRTLLTSLPTTIQSKPAVQLMLEELRSTGDSTGGDNNDGINAQNQKTTPKSPIEEADSLFALGQYKSACEWYEKGAPGKPTGKDIGDGWTLDAQLRYVQALAMTGQHEASQALFESLGATMKDLGIGSPLLDANVLETKALPRSSNINSSSTAKSSIAKNLDATITNGQNDDNRANRPSRDKVLRQRARKREAHLKELEAKGQYNPDRPSVPNPERWIPKHERSRSRGGGKGSRANQGTNRSAQGGGSQADALRLDAAARRAGTAPAPTGPSTANLKVSSGGRKGGRRR